MKKVALMIFFLMCLSPTYAVSQDSDSQNLKTIQGDVIDKWLGYLLLTKAPVTGIKVRATDGEVYLLASYGHKTDLKLDQKVEVTFDAKETLVITYDDSGLRTDWLAIKKYKILKDCVDEVKIKGRVAMVRYGIRLVDNTTLTLIVVADSENNVYFLGLEGHSRDFSSGQTLEVAFSKSDHVAESQENFIIEHEDGTKTVVAGAVRWRAIKKYKILK